MRLALYHDKPDSETAFQEIRERNLLHALQALDSRAKRKGLEALDPKRSPLVAIGTEHKDGKVTKNSYGVFNLAWQFAEHPEWADQISREAAELKAAIRNQHGAPLQFLIWAGMGGSAEDKSAYNACDLLKRNPHCYVLDSTDPNKLNAILEDMQRRGKRPLRELLPRTLVVGMAMGMTSYEPVVNLERLAALFDSCSIDAKKNFLYMTLPGSLLDQFAGPRGFRRVELQPDEANSTAGRHSSPLTRGSLYPLALAGVDLNQWIQGTALTEEEVETALRLSCFLHQQALQGRDKVTLLLPRSWEGIALWTKQDFEESLGKSDDIGIKILIDEKPRMTHYLPPKQAGQDRVFLSVQRQGEKSAAAEKTTLIRRAGYPTAILTIGKDRPLSTYMQFMHYVVFGLGYLRNMNFVTQPSVELYKAITNRLYEKARQDGGASLPSAGEKSLEWRGRVSLRWNALRNPGAPKDSNAPGWYAQLLHTRVAAGPAEYGELTFFGDMRYDARGRMLQRVLRRAGDTLFRAGLRKPVDIYEGPAMNHSYHEMVIGHGRCFSTVLISDAPAEVQVTGDNDLYHRCQFFATQMALEERGRDVVSIHLRDLSPKSMEALDSFFEETGRRLKALKRAH